MFNLKLLALVAGAGAVGGIYVSGLVKEKLGLGNGEKNVRNKTQVIKLKPGEKYVGGTIVIADDDGNEKK